MPPKKRTTKEAPARPSKRNAKPPASLDAQVDDVIASLKKLSSKATRDGMARYAIPSDKAFGVPVGVMRKLAKEIGRNHELALALWETGWYEARMMATFLDDPALVTSAQMDRWCKDFDSWAICDTACFCLFDRTPTDLAFRKVAQWAKKRDEFVKRGAFALLASLALHDKATANARFVACLPLIETAASDDRNFVKKGVSWALRSIGARNPEMRTSALKVATRLADSEDPGAQWVGQDAVRDLMKPAQIKRAERNAKKAIQSG